MDKKYIYTGIGILILAVVIILVFANGNNQGVTGNVISDANNNKDNINKDEIVVITMTHCPECREGLKPYLDKAEELGTNIKEYQVSSPFDPKTNQILSENGLRLTRMGMPILCINDNCFTTMRSVEAELNRFLE